MQWSESWSLRHVGTRELLTERLRLRRFVMEDARDMFDNWSSHPEVTRYSVQPLHATVEETRERVRGWVEGYERPDHYRWCICLRDDPTAIGTITLETVRADACVGSIGYALSPSCWNRGYMSEAARAVLREAMLSVNYNRVIAHYDARNPASAGVMRKAGMAFEGVFRQSSLVKGELIDVGQCAALRCELFPEAPLPYAE